jgi:hypothetical protein
MIRVTDLIKNRNGARILRGVSFEVPPQRCSALWRSGGKTTLTYVV